MKDSIKVMHAFKWRLSLSFQAASKSAEFTFMTCLRILEKIVLTSPANLVPIQHATATTQVGGPIFFIKPLVVISVIGTSCFSGPGNS